MIAMLTGEVKHLSVPTACLMTAAGVGYDVELPLSSFCQLQVGQTATLWTHLLVREDVQALYGFVEKSDRDAFRKLIKITGVGAKMALAMLSAMSASELNGVIEQGDELALTKIAGVGKKTAQRLLIELKGKLGEFADGKFAVGQMDLVQNDEMHIIAEVELALMGLGYKEKEAQHAIKIAKTELDEPLTVQSLLKAGLKSLSKGR